jgi:excisionase family DNA binding protein
MTATAYAEPPLRVAGQRRPQPLLADRDLITAAEATALLGIHRVTIRRWALTDETFPRLIRFGRTDYLSRTALDAWLARKIGG